MNKILFSLVVVLFLLVLGGGYYFYKVIHSPIVKIEEKGSFENMKVGEGRGIYAKCPADKKAMSGGCISYSPNFSVNGSGELVQSNSNLTYFDAWQCNFESKSDAPGAHAYAVTVNCQ